MIICADDFGYSTDINEAILELVQMGRVTAVSFMVSLPQCAEAMRANMGPRLEGNADLGLHFNLTEGVALSDARSISSLVDASGAFPAFRELLRRSRAGEIEKADVERELASQYARFVSLAGHSPDFVDGHMHVQQFPVIRDGVISFLKQTTGPGKPHVRNAYQPFSKILRQGVSPLKCFWISLYGGALRRRLVEADILTNSGFAGIYDYARYEQYPMYLQRFFEFMEGPHGILMTHPGKVEPWRRIEFETLRAVNLSGVVLNRFPDR